MTVAAQFHETAGDQPSPVDESYSLTGEFTATRTFRGPWALRAEFVREMLGQPYPGYVTAIARSARVAPATRVAVTGTNGVPNTYEAAQVTIQYDTQASGGAAGSGGGSSGVKVDPEDGIAVEEDTSPAAEYLVAPHTGLYWAAGATDPIDPIEAPGMLERMQSLTIKMSNVPAADWPTNINDYMTSINSEDITLYVSGRTLGAEKVMFNGATWSQQSSNGEVSDLISASLSFTLRTHSWNKFKRSTTGAYQSIYLANGNLFTPFAAINFANVLKIKVA